MQYKDSGMSWKIGWNQQVGKSGQGIYVLQLLVDLLTEILFTAGAVVSPKINAPGFIQAAIQDIDAHFSSNLSLAYFSDKLKINKYYFAKVFKKYTGFSPIEYIINTRINNAKEFLQYSDAMVSEISTLVGFNNTCHFINSFKQKAGFTPLKFRKQYQANTKWSSAKNSFRRSDLTHPNPIADANVSISWEMSPIPRELWWIGPSLHHSRKNWGIGFASLSLPFG